MKTCWCKTVLFCRKFKLFIYIIQCQKIKIKHTLKISITYINVHKNVSLYELNGLSISCLLAAREKVMLFAIPMLLCINGINRVVH